MDDLRMGWDLPQDDVDLIYEILTRCELGLPLQKICIMLGFKSSEFSRTWKLIREVESKYKVKVTPWRAGGSTWIIIKNSEGLMGFYEAQYHNTRKRTLAKINPAERNALKILSDMELCTMQDLVNTIGYSRTGCQKLLKRWVEGGFVEVVEQGGRGIGNAMKFQVIRTK